MSKIYTYSEAKQNLATLLQKAAEDGSVRVKRKDGTTFIIQPEEKYDLPLDVEGMDLDMSKEDIVLFIHEGRKEHE